MSEDTVKAEVETTKKEVVESDVAESSAAEKEAVATDPLDEKQEKSAKFPTLLIVLLVVLGLIGLVIFSSRYSIDKKAVGTQISGIEDVLSKQFSAAGSNLSFDYDTMDVKGGLFSKHIVIDKPRFSLKNPDGSQIVITSNALIAEPTSRDGKEILFHAGDDVTLEKNGERYTLTSSERLKLKVTNSDEGLHYSVKLPHEINLRNIATNLRYAAITSAKGSFSGAVGEASSIVFNATDATLFLKQRQLIASSVSFKNDYSYKAGAMLSDITVDAKGSSFSAPYNLFGALDVAAKASFETASFSEEYGIPSEQNIVIDSLTASNGEINASLDGTFQFLENELIPLGNAAFKVDGVNALFTTLSRSNLLDERGEKMLRKVLNKAAKEWKPSEDGVVVEFQREYGGGFYIGDVTFEELVALALRSYFGTTEKAAVVEVPAPVADKEATPEKPLETGAVDAQQVEAEVKQELQKNGVVISDATLEAAQETEELIQEPAIEAPLVEKNDKAAEETITEVPEAVAVEAEEPKLGDAVKVEDAETIVEAAEETLDSVVPSLDVPDAAAMPADGANKAIEAIEAIEAVEAVVEVENINENSTSATDAVKSDIEAATEEVEALKDAAQDALETSPATQNPELQTPELGDTSAAPDEAQEVEKIDDIGSISSKELGLEQVIGEVNAAIDEAEQANEAASTLLDALPTE